MLKLLKYPMTLLAVVLLAACPPKASASPPIVTNVLSEAGAADSFKVTATFTIADPTKAAYTVSWHVTIADSVGGAVLKTLDVPVGTTATATIGKTLTPGQRFTVAVTAQGVNQAGALSAASAPSFAGYTALIGPPSTATNVNVSICKMGDPGC